MLVWPPEKRVSLQPGSCSCFSAAIQQQCFLCHVLVTIGYYRIIADESGSFNLKQLSTDGNHDWDHGNPEAVKSWQSSNFGGDMCIDHHGQGSLYGTSSRISVLICLAVYLVDHKTAFETLNIVCMVGSS